MMFNVINKYNVINNTKCLFQCYYRILLRKGGLKIVSLFLMFNAQFCNKIIVEKNNNNDDYIHN